MNEKRSWGRGCPPVNGGLMPALPIASTHIKPTWCWSGFPQHCHALLWPVVNHCRMLLYVSVWYVRRMLVWHVPVG